MSFAKPFGRTNLFEFLQIKKFSYVDYNVSSTLLEFVK
jgi:hypothetical protein